MIVPLLGCMPRITGGIGNYWVACEDHGWEGGPYHFHRDASLARREHRKYRRRRKDMYEVTVTQISTHRFLVEADDAAGAEAEAVRRLDRGDDGDPRRLYREVENVSVSPYTEEVR